ncbi:hypothetical protein WJX82_011227 [Trebouxia sp. C0006]
MIRGLEAYVLPLYASQLPDHGVGEPFLAVILLDCWVKIEWRSKPFALDVQALDQCIHVIIREPALFLQNFWGHLSCVTNSQFPCKVQQCLAYHAQLAIIQQTECQGPCHHICVVYFQGWHAHAPLFSVLKQHGRWGADQFKVINVRADSKKIICIRHGAGCVIPSCALSEAPILVASAPDWSHLSKGSMNIRNRKGWFQIASKHPGCFSSSLGISSGPGILLLLRPFDPSCPVRLWHFWTQWDKPDVVKGYVC